MGQGNTLGETADQTAQNTARNIGWVQGLLDATDVALEGNDLTDDDRSQES